MTINKKSLQLLSCLRHNGREKLVIISRKTRIPVSTLFDMLKELQGRLITRNTVLLDFSKLGYHTRAHVFMKVGREQKEKLKQHLLYHKNINSLYKINSGWDFVIETVHRNNKELDTFLDKIMKQFDVEEKEIHYLIDEVKKEGFVPQLLYSHNS